eukprot:TRINITY_DN20025_c0_g1_i1.p2 TRINITY_DN20025_c0_g1~~TRINITY_DN20025_c0_g1_i1.p2  ORF type:complete len:159 (-),score=32.17 TRINITY_DN20025_c0_g1_i1:45-521(-)
MSWKGPQTWPFLQGAALESGKRQLSGSFEHVHHAQPPAVLRPRPVSLHSPMPLPAGGPQDTASAASPSSLARSSSWAGEDQRRSRPLPLPLHEVFGLIQKRPPTKAPPEEPGLRVQLEYAPRGEPPQATMKEHRMGFRGCRWGSTTMRLGGPHFMAGQ